MESRIAGIPLTILQHHMQWRDSYPYCANRDKLGPILYRMDYYDIQIGMAVDDLSQVIDMLRADKRYLEADRLRTIAGRLARARRRNDREENSPGLVLTQARGWR